MGKDWKEMKSYTLTSNEVERLLLDDYGDKLQPVNDAKMAALRRQRIRYQDSRQKQGDADEQKPRCDEPLSKNTANNPDHIE